MMFLFRSGLGRLEEPIHPYSTLRIHTAAGLGDGGVVHTNGADRLFLAKLHTVRSIGLILPV